VSTQAHRATADAIAATVAAERAAIIASLIRLTGDWTLAEDCVQDAVERALLQWPREGIPRSPAAWLTTVARHRALDVLRRRHVQDVHPAVADVEHDDGLFGHDEPGDGGAHRGALGVGRGLCVDHLVADVESLADRRLVGQAARRARERPHGEGAGLLAGRMPAEPVGDGHDNRGADREVDRLWRQGGRGAQRPRAHGKAVLVVVSHQPIAAKRGDGNVLHSRTLLSR
jgi:DNA-directed RNA polymerase specialized sigma24 family protein